MTLAGRTLFISGGSRGIGLAIALRAARDGDIRDEDQVTRAVALTVERFGGIDVCVNNASAINLSGTEALEIRRYDLMQSINTRGTFVVSRACVPHLKGPT